MRSERLLLLAVLLVSGAIAASAPTSAFAAAPALQPGVHVDPGSPAAKEYSIPLQQARGQSPSGPAAGSGGAQSGGGTAGGLFGSGIKPKTTARVTSAASNPDATHRRHRTSLPSSTSSLAGTGAVAVTRAAADTSGSASGVDWMLGAGVLILALGALGGAAVARFRRRAGTRMS
jgi:hypothetical protein